MIKLFAKSIIVILAFSLLVSCQTKPKKVTSPATDISQSDMSDNNKAQLEDNQIIEEDANNYQVLQNEEQAAAANQAEDAKAQEVEVQDRIFFNYDSSDLDDEAKKIAATQIEWLQNSPEIKVTIEGHCDERGTREYNIALGERRANSLKQYLEQNGIDPARIRTISYGKERPAYLGTSEDIYKKNRRAVVVVD